MKTKIKDLLQQEVAKDANLKDCKECKYFHLGEQVTCNFLETAHDDECHLLKARFYR